MLTLPNLLTLSRFVFAVLIVLLLMTRNLNAAVMAVILFMAASVTDFYDGYLAKKRGQISDFGKIMDPIADKVLVLSIFAVLAHLALWAWWMVAVIAVREVLVTASRLAAMKRGRVLAAEQAGKIKTVLQILTISVALLFVVFDEGFTSSSWFHKIERGWLSLINGLMWASMIMTLLSGAMYFQSKCKKQKT